MGNLLVFWTIAVVAAASGVEMAEEKRLPELRELWDFQDPEGTENRFRDLLPGAEASGDLDYELQVLTQIGRALGLQGRFEEAHELLLGVERRLTDGTRTARVRYLLERGRTWNSSKKPDRAVPLFLEAWERGREWGLDLLAVDAAHMMAIAVPPGEKLAWNLKAMDLAESSEDPRAALWLGSLYNNIGWDYHDQGEYEKALEVHRKGWEWHQARDRERGVETPGRGTLIARWSVAKDLRMLGRVAQALAIQYELLEGYRRAEVGEGFVQEEIGECLLLQGKDEEARPHFAEAWRLLKEISWVAEDDPERLKRIRGLAGE